MSGEYDMTQARIARFEKVSFEQFEQGWRKAMPDAGKENIREVYDAIKLPRRATAASAGYDFFLPADLSLAAGEGALIPTGIRAKMDPGWVLCCFPRSGLGFKYRLQLDNTVGIIDADYYGSDNEGHIFCKITCDKKCPNQSAASAGIQDSRAPQAEASREAVLQLSAGDAFMQGVFLPYGLTEDDDVADVRNGGFGSTDA